MSQGSSLAEAYRDGSHLDLTVNSLLREDLFEVVVNPANDRDVVRHETRYLAFHQNVVAPNDVFVLGFGRIVLAHS